MAKSMIFLSKKYCGKKLKMVVCGCNRNIAKKQTKLCLQKSLKV